MSDIRRGKQTPTICIRLPYTESLGTEAVDLYNQSDRTAKDWQALMLEDIMAVNADGLWIRMKYGWFGYSTDFGKVLDNFCRL